MSLVSARQLGACSMPMRDASYTMCLSKVCLNMDGPWAQRLLLAVLQLEQQQKLSLSDAICWLINAMHNRSNAGVSAEWIFLLKRCYA